MQLSRRLKAVADSVTRGNRVADVGCDHAYISIYLIEHNIAPRVIAMDVNKGPLSRAFKNIQLYHYEDKIETRLSNGLEHLDVDEVDTILLAGMGGNLMIQILEAKGGVVENARELVLQPQSELSLVRKYLHSIGYQIEKEDMLIEDGKYYVIMKASKITATMKDETKQSWDEKTYYAKKIFYERVIFYEYGKLLLEAKSPVLYQYLLKEKEQRLEVVARLKENDTIKSKTRLEEVLQEIGYINEAFEYFIDNTTL